MTVERLVARRGIREVLHFTTNRGALGIFATKAIKSRARLDVDPFLELIFYPNAAQRPRDAAWLDYVNLSVSRINGKFFSICSDAWHKDNNLWWAIFSCRAEVLTHAGVQFATTNNMYSGVQRAPGEAGLEALFAENIVQWHSNGGSRVGRMAALAAHYPTCNQAEVLYPGEVSTDFVGAIYARSDENADEISGQMAAVSDLSIPIEVRPDLFPRKA